MASSNDSPTIPFDTTIIYQMMRDMRRDLLDDNEKTRNAIRAVGGQLAAAQNQIITMTNSMQIIAQEAADSRSLRLQAEVARDEREKKILQERIKVVDEQLQEKKTMSNAAILSDTGKIKLAANMTYEEREKLEEEEIKALWKKRKEAAITAVITWASVGAVAVTVTFFIFLIRMFMER